MALAALLPLALDADREGDAAEIGAGGPRSGRCADAEGRSEKEGPCQVSGREDSAHALSFRGSCVRLVHWGKATGGARAAGVRGATAAATPLLPEWESLGPARPYAATAMRLSTRCS